MDGTQVQRRNHRYGETDQMISRLDLSYGHRLVGHFLVVNHSEPASHRHHRLLATRLSHSRKEQFIINLTRPEVASPAGCWGGH
jgi:hypothetical protein